MNKTETSLNAHRKLFDIISDCIQGSRLTASDLPDDFLAIREAMKECQNTEAPSEMFPVSDWQYEVANGDTKLGYDEWLEHRIESEEESPKVIIDVRGGVAYLRDEVPGVEVEIIDHDNH